MTTEPAAPGDAHALHPVTNDAHGHPTHDHGHNHGHPHDHAHGTHQHTHSHLHAPASPIPSAAPRPTRISLLMHSAALRLAGAVALSALLWAAVAWALSGTP